MQTVDILLPYLSNASPNILELFARSVASGKRSDIDSGFWLSVGKEALKFNQVPHNWQLNPAETVV